VADTTLDIIASKIPRSPMRETENLTLAVAKEWWHTLAAFVEEGTR
jgi:hypothetical protein